jgi:DNA topoisomerase-2
MGLHFKEKYLTPDALKNLRYGKIMIMTDQDQDGSHIKGLLVNFIHHFWPDLLKQNFLEQFITPIVKVCVNLITPIVKVCVILNHAHCQGIC